MAEMKYENKGMGTSWKTINHLKIKIYEWHKKLY
jgi:hypothetical protein